MEQNQVQCELFGVQMLSQNKSINHFALLCSGQIKSTSFPVSEQLAVCFDLILTNVSKAENDSEIVKLDKNLSLKITLMSCTVL